MQITDTYAPPDPNQVEYTDGKDATSFSDLGQFLELFVSQLENQDPLSPMDSSELFAQTAQLTTVEQLIALNNNTVANGESLDALGQSLAASYLGKLIAANVESPEGEVVEVIGQVSDVFYGEEGEPQLGLTTGEVVSLSEVVNVAL